ncbi:MAG: hypothetical protein JWN91_2951 [Nocardioides sp.]|nr:hypothetical protein [Nocardioides sp.]
MRAAVTVAGMALVLGGLTGCGGGSGGGGGGASAPDDASKKDFCAAFNGFYEKVVSQATDADSASMIKALKEWAGDIEDVGTPSEMPEEARHGFELFIAAANDIDDDATLEDLQIIGDDLSDADQKDGQAFSDWTTDNCPLDIPGLPDASDLPSDLPTGLSDLPSDLPTDPSELESMLSELTASAGS